MSLKEPSQEVVDLTSDSEDERVERALDHAIDELDVGEGEGEVYEDYSDDEDDTDGADSLTGDIFHQLIDTNTDMSRVPDACTPEEAIKYRQKLRNLGPEEFCRDTVEAGKITAKKLLTAFSIRPPDFLEGADDESYYPLLGIALQKEISTRRKLEQYNSLDDVVDLLNTRENILVLTGAGISTSLGIPDFRSKNNGLYAKIQADPRLKSMGINEGSDIFDLLTFQEDPSIFYEFAREIVPPRDGLFTPTHAFIRLLQDKGKLLTNYTQNIDNIERAAGIDPEKLVQCHGSFATATCLQCKFNYAADYIMPSIHAKKVPLCSRGKECVAPLPNSLPVEAPGMKRKRSDNGSSKKRRKGSSDSDKDDDILGPGVIKPDITFFGEQLPDRFSERLTKHDRDLVDLVVVIGTSLKVAPVSEIVPYLPYDVPQVIITRDRVKHVEFDVELLGDADVVVAELCRRLDWKLQHEMIPASQIVDISPLPHPGNTSENPLPPLKFAHLLKARPQATQTSNGTDREEKVYAA